MKYYGFISKVKLIVLCLVAMFIVYMTLLKLPLNYQHINSGSDELLSFKLRYVPNNTFTDNGQFMQMVDIPQGINHVIGKVISDKDVEYFIDLPQLNKPLIYNFAPPELEIILSLGLNDSDTTFLNNGGFIQMYDIEGGTNHIITEVIPNSDIEYFINPVELGEPNIQELSPVESSEE